jgi:hypothetical protein
MLSEQILPTLQQVLSILWEKECDRESISASSAHCLVDIDLLSGVRIEPGAVPVIRVSCIWMQDLIYSGRSDELLRAIRRAVLLLPRFIRTLLNSATRAAVYEEKARTYRATHPEDFSLPERHFRAIVSLTLTCPITGETETVQGITVANLPAEMHNARHRLTARVFMHDQVAELLDRIEAARLAREGPPPEPSAVVVSTHDTTTVLTLEYSDE